MRKYKSAMILTMALVVTAVGAQTSLAAHVVTGGAAKPGQTAEGLGTQAKKETGSGVGSEASKEAGNFSAGAAREDVLPVVDGVIIPENLEAAKEADQMIVVTGLGGCQADIYYYVKNNDSWDMVWSEAGIVGRNGISAEKAEGDGKTPAGTYSFNLSFGLKENPGSILPYHKIVKGDYWVDDGASPYYNQLVNTSSIPKNWNSAENLASASPYYNYALALNYNEERTPGKGSAIFLHCFTATADNGSAGCIRLPEHRVKELIQAATDKTRIVIAPDMSQLR